MGTEHDEMTSGEPAEPERLHIGSELTHLLVVSDMERSRAFYTEVLGADLEREYGGTSVVLDSSAPGCSS
jgi:hypothetical protein